VLAVVVVVLVCPGEVVVVVAPLVPAVPIVVPAEIMFGCSLRSQNVANTPSCGDSGSKTCFPGPDFRPRAKSLSSVSEDVSLYSSTVAFGISLFCP